MNNSENHSKLVHQVLLELGAKYPNIRAWKNHTGAAYTLESVKRALSYLFKSLDAAGAMKMLVTIHYGMVGSADISGIMFGGKRIEIECKTGLGKQSDKQKAYQKMITDMGGIYIEVRHLDDLKKLAPPVMM